MRALRGGDFATPHKGGPSGMALILPLRCPTIPTPTPNLSMPPAHLDGLQLHHGRAPARGRRLQPMAQAFQALVHLGEMRVCVWGGGDKIEAQCLP